MGKQPLQTVHLPPTTCRHPQVYASLTTRVWHGAASPEVEWTVGPLPQLEGSAAGVSDLCQYVAQTEEPWNSEIVRSLGPCLLFCDVKLGRAVWSG